MAVHLFGIRHHGPGSARSLVQALQALDPDAVLVEGPPDADAILPLAIHEQMQPPVALLIYVKSEPSRAAYFPFATFSPEWQAIAFALRRHRPVRFIDLPMRHQLAMREDESPPARDDIARDPLRYIALAAGYGDGERWWEHMVEERRDHRAVFEAIAEAMAALRAEIGERPGQVREACREAHMRRSIRAAVGQGFERIAVVCGAWHVPSLSERARRGDGALLKGLPRVAVEATWVPWTHGRLTLASGYGAGVRAPGWYHHLWSAPEQVSVGWLTAAARVLRERGIDASSAQVIDAVRLAETLAALRERPLPGLEEHQEALRAVLLAGEELPMKLIFDRLVVGARVGRVPDETPAVPLQRDLARLQKTLRLPPREEIRALVLDLRKDIDRGRSQLLRRLRLLGIDWGQGGERAGGTGTFRESWMLAWRPELSVAIIEAAVWGNSVEEAAARRARERAASAGDLATLTRLASEVLLADLSGAVAAVMDRVDAQAAVGSDVSQLMDALPPFAELLRYGDVRGTERSGVARIVQSLVARTCVGLSAVSAGLAEEAAREMLERVERVHGALALVGEPLWIAPWHQALGELLDAKATPGLLQGHALRLLLDAGRIELDDTARRLGLALGAASDPPHAAAWIEGFLRGSGQLLVHDDRLFELVDRWLMQLSTDAFAALVPLLRRTASAWSAPERRMLAERVAAKRGSPDARTLVDFDVQRADAVLPLVARLIGREDGP